MSTEYGGPPPEEGSEEAEASEERLKEIRTEKFAELPKEFVTPLESMISPDFSHILLVGSSEEEVDRESNRMIVDLSAKQADRFDKEFKRITNLGWSHDSKTKIFVGANDRTPNSERKALLVRNGKIVDTAQEIKCAVIRPDGEDLAYTKMRSTADNMTVDPVIGDYADNKFPRYDISLITYSPVRSEPNKWAFAESVGDDKKTEVIVSGLEMSQSLDRKMDKISDIQFSPDGKDLYFSGIQDGMSRLFKSNEVLYDAETSEIISFRISPNSSDYALLRRDNHYHRRGKDQIIINDQEYSDRFVETKEFFSSPDSRKLVIVGIQYDDESTDDPNKENAEYIHVYNTQNGEKDISGPYRSIHCPTFNEDGSRLACIVLKTGENNFFLKVDEEEYKLDIASKGRKGEKVFLGLKFSINESDNKEVLEIMTNRNNRIEKKVFAVPNSKEEKEVIRMWRQEGEEGLF